jgi:hypothetical protein
LSSQRYFNRFHITTIWTHLKGALFFYFWTYGRCLPLLFVSNIQYESLFSCIIILTSYVFYYIKREPVFSSLYIGGNWKSWVLQKSYGIMWGCRTNDYLQFPSWIYYYFIPHIFQLQKFFSTWLKSLKWIQLLCDYISSPRVA